MVDQEMIKNAIMEWEAHTCLRFQETKKKKEKKKHLIFIKSVGCWSYIGKTKDKKQKVSIGEGCNYVGFI